MKISTFFLHWNLGSPKMPELFPKWTHIDFRASVCKTTDLISSFKFQISSFLFSLEFAEKLIDFFSCSGHLMNQI